jgi:hypothetical protein
MKIRRTLTVLAINDSVSISILLLIEASWYGSSCKKQFFKTFSIYNLSVGQTFLSFSLGQAFLLILVRQECPTGLGGLAYYIVSFIILKNIIYHQSNLIDV